MPLALGRVLEQVADRFAQRRAARLARDEDLVARVRQALGKPLDLGRFADGFAAFERDEFGERRAWRLGFNKINENNGRPQIVEAAVLKIL